LISLGHPLRKIHALQALLDVAMASHPGLEGFRPLCERVSGYYVLARYPGTGEAPEVEQVQQDRDEARNLILALFPDEKLA
jgi:HEPN domain-containing protein